MVGVSGHPPQWAWGLQRPQRQGAALAVAGWSSVLLYREAESSRQILIAKQSNSSHRIARSRAGGKKIETCIKIEDLREREKIRARRSIRVSIEKDISQAYQA